MKYNRRITKRVLSSGDEKLREVFKKRQEELSKVWFADESGFDGDHRPRAKYTKRRNKSKKIILVLYNASWHKTKSLDRHHIEPSYLQPYSSDLNPIERLWLRIKADFFANFTAKSPEELTNRLVEALTYSLKHKKLFYYLNLCNYF